MQQQSPRKHLYLSEEGQRLLRERLRVNYIQHSDRKINLSPELEKLEKKIEDVNTQQTNELLDKLDPKNSRVISKWITNTVLGTLFCILGIVGSYEYAQAQFLKSNKLKPQQICINLERHHANN